MACLRERVTQRTDLCIISDRHRGIITTMNDDYSGWGAGRAHHRFCVRHLASNFNSRFHDKSLKMLLVKVAYERRPRKFNHRMERIARINTEVKAWLCAIPLVRKALSHNGGRRFGLMMTNFSEVFNSVLKGVRNVPITACVQMTFYRVNNYFVLRRKAAAARIAESEQYPTQISSKLLA